MDFSNLLQKKLPFLFFIVGGVLVVLVLLEDVGSLYDTSSNNNVETNGTVARFPLDSLLSLGQISRFGTDRPDIGSARVVALFVLAPSMCSPCMFEVREYLSLIHSSLDILPVVMLTTPDSTIARHISEVAGIDSDILFGIDDFVLSSLFRTSENNENVLLFIQNGETVVHKVSLPANMISSSQNKTDILAAVRRMTSSRFMEYLPAHGS